MRFAVFHDHADALTAAAHEAAAPEDVLIAATGMQLSGFWSGERSLDYDVPHVINRATVRLLRSRGQLQDCSGLELDFHHIERWLVDKTGGKGKCAEEIRLILGFEPVYTARLLGSLAAEHPRFVRLVLQGRLRTAARRISATDPRNPDYQKMLEALEAMGCAHLVMNQRAAARRAMCRLMEPTGHEKLDSNRGAVVTTGSAARQLVKISKPVDRVSELESRRRKGKLTTREEETVASFGLATEAEQLESYFRGIYGDFFTEWYEDMMRLVRRWTRYIRVQAKSVDDSDIAANALHLMHGPESLPMFFLSVEYAVAWTRERGQEPSALSRTIDALIMGKPIHYPIIDPSLHDDARQLFYLLRNTCIRDPRAYASRKKTFNSHRSLEDVVFAKFDHELDRNTTGEALRHGPIEAAARKLHAIMHLHPLGGEATAIRNEAFGAIIVQLKA
jgi:hypothetical protein